MRTLLITFAASTLSVVCLAAPATSGAPAANLLPDHNSSCFPLAPGIEPVLGDCDATIKQADAVPIESRTLAAAHNNRGILLAKSEQWEGALADFDTALSLQPDLNSARVNRGNVLLHMDRFIDALAAYDAALSSLAGNPRIALFNRVFAQRALGNVEQAIRDLHEAQRLAEAERPNGQ